MGLENVPGWDPGTELGGFPIEGFDVNEMVTLDAVMYHFNWGSITKIKEESKPIIHQRLKALRDGQHEGAKE